MILKSYISLYSVEVGFPEPLIEVSRNSNSVEVEVRLLEGTLGSDEGIPLACFTMDGTATGVC